MTETRALPVPWAARFFGGTFSPSRRFQIAVWGDEPPPRLVVWHHRDARGIYEIQTPDVSRQDALWRGELYELGADSVEGWADYRLLGEHPSPHVATAPTARASQENQGGFDAFLP